MEAIENGRDGARFDEFKPWPIGGGRATFERAVDDAEVVGVILAEEDEDQPFARDLRFACRAAHEAATGNPLPTPLDHEDWSTDEWKRRLPRIWSVWGWEERRRAPWLEEDWEPEPLTPDQRAMHVRVTVEDVSDELSSVDEEHLDLLQETADDLARMVRAERERRS
jgi:hypothetical protein